MPHTERILEAPFTDVPGAVEEIRAGRMVVVVDDEDRENEGDLTLAAEQVTPEAINFMARYGRGLICLTLTEERADHLRLFPMTQHNSSRFGTAFTETIEAREGVTTGISAADRAHTIRVAIDPKSTAVDLARPGHIFPLRARRGGVLVRAGQTEASVDLARLAGLNPSGVICEIMRDDGEMARIPDLIPFCRQHGLKILTVAELIRYRLRHERYIVRAGETRIQTRYGEFRMIAYESEVNGDESHIALVRGELCEDCPAMTDGPAGHPRTAWRAHAVFPRGAGQGAHALHGRRCFRRRLPLPRSHRPVHAHDRRGRLRSAPLPAQHVARIPDRPHSRPMLSNRAGRSLQRRLARPTPAGSSCTRNCAPAKGRRTAPGASCAPSAWAARSSPILGSSAFACCQTRPCTSPRSKALAWRLSNRSTSPSRNAHGWDRRPKERGLAMPGAR